MCGKLSCERIWVLLQKIEGILCMEGPNLIRDTGRSREIDLGMLKFVIPLRSASQVTKFKFFMFPLLAAALCATASVAAWRCAVFLQLGVGGRRNMSFFFSLFYSFLSCPFPFFFLFFCLFLFLIILPLFSVSFSSSLGAEKDQKHCNCFIW